MGWRAWTGVGERRWKTAADEHVEPPKTLWDWLQLLIVPAILIGVTFAWSASQTTSDNRREDRRIKAERGAAEQVRQDGTLNDYIQQMSDLTLNKNLFSSEPGDPVRSVARTVTLTTLRRLDGARKGEVIRFLSEARLLRVEPAAPVALAGADLTYARLTGADLRGADLTYTDLRGARLTGAHLTGAHLTNADLRRADLTYADLLGADLTAADLLGADLTAADLRGAYLRVAVLIGAHLTYADLRGAHLTGARLSGAHLTYARLRGADLRDADLRGAHLTGARLSGAHLTGANLKGANLKGAEGLPKKRR